MADRPAARGHAVVRAGAPTRRALSDFLALGGIAIAFLPNSPNWTLEPTLALALFVAPVLLDAAFDTSTRDLRDNWLPVTMLVLAAVGVTTVAVAFVARWLVPDMPWAAAVALGAIVAPRTRQPRRRSCAVSGCPIAS
jgi:CPA1 family monovalent cation:H+ antiporter